MGSRILLKTSLVIVLNMLAVDAYADHTWNNFSWARTSNPFTLKVVDSTTADWFVELDEAMTKWSLSNVLNLQITASDDSASSRQMCPMVSGQIRVCNDSYGTNGWLGLASVGIDSNGHIDRGAALMNDSYSSHWNSQAQKNHVMCQEIGHLFGLGHTSENGSSQQTCMDYSSSEDSQWPNAHDFEFLEVVYYGVNNYNSYDDGLDNPDGGSDPAPDPEPDPAPEPDPGTDDGGGGGGKGKKGEKGDNGKGGGKGRVKFGSTNLAQTPPMGIRVTGNRHEEIWVSSRRDGGLWVHHVRLVPELHDDDHEHEEVVDDGHAHEEVVDDGHAH
jgi:hypothetical protein